jgi:predicted DNA-binding transcriptional regulator AlpA
MDLDELVREPRRREITGISPSLCRQLEQAGTFPRRVIIHGKGPRALVGWRLSELQEFVKSRQRAPFLDPFGDEIAAE